jgi:RNA polymerase sigma-70 factor (ECF subfamily)
MTNREHAGERVMSGVRIRLTGSADDRAAAFSFLLDRSTDRSLRLASAILLNRDEAEDALADAALRAWQHFSSLRDPAKFDAWFGRILVNVCRDRLHQRRPTSTLGFDPPTSADAFADSVERVVLFDTLATLSPEHRAVIALHYLEGLTVDQIAERLGTAVGTVKSRLHYGLAELRAAYDASLREPERTTR